MTTEPILVTITEGTEIFVTVTDPTLSNVNLITQVISLADANSGGPGADGAALEIESGSFVWSAISGHYRYTETGDQRYTEAGEPRITES
jgi:hypothetical protein